MLRVAELSVSYGPIAAVRSLDLEVGSGEALALLGPNGAGKSSTLAALSGLVPFAGSVDFDGLDVARARPHHVARRGLLHVPEGRRVFVDLTVEENLRLGALARSGRPATYGIDEVLDLFPALVPLRTRLGYALSGGEQQMVAIGRALMGAPRLLLLDEPSLGLAPIVARAVFDALAEIRKDTAIIVVEQNTELALELCSTAVVLVGGQVALAGPAADVRRRDLLASYLGQGDARTEEAAPSGPEAADSARSARFNGDRR